MRETISRKLLTVTAGVFLVSSVLFINSSCNKQQPTPTTATETKTQIGDVEFPNSSINTIADIDAELQAFYNPDNNGASSKPLWQKIKKWVKSHTGTHLFNGCNGSNPCGPCPGICIALSVHSNPATDSTYNQGDHANALGTFGLTRIADDKFILEFVDNSEFVINDVFYAPQDIDLGKKIEKMFDVEKFIIKQGVYPLSYKTNVKGETVITVITE